MKKRKLRRKLKFRLYLFLLYFIIISLFLAFIVQFEKYVVPMAISISQKYATNMISLEIDKSVETVIEQMRLVTGDFLNKTFEEDGSNFLDVDTILVNNLCAKISKELSKNLINTNDTRIKLPIGIFSGLNAFSNIGPKFSVLVSSMGDAVVDYHTKFESVGINQINFQVILKVDTKIAIVNPLYKKDINVTRNIVLVNTVFNGKVPNTYLNMDNKK